jgi:hypothetical protein
MFIAAFFLLCSTAWLICVTRGSERVAQVAVAPLAMAFMLVYVFVSTQVAQDREQYYQWYVQAQAILESGGGTDPFFTLLLTAMPERLGRSAFGAVFSGLLFIALAAFTFLATRHRTDGFVMACLIVLLAVTDRLFLDLCANTSRSALAGLLLLVASVVRRKLWPLAIVLLAGAVHAKFTALALLLASVAYLLRSHPNWQRLLLVLGLVLFGLRAVTGRTFFDGLAIVELLLQSEREDFRRGVLITTGVTGSRAVQIALAVLLPLALAGRHQTDRFLQAGTDILRDRLLRSIAFTFSAAALILYPEIQLAERLFLVPMLLLPTLISMGRVKALAALKIPIICVVLFSQFDKLY